MEQCRLCGNAAPLINGHTAPAWALPERIKMLLLAMSILADEDGQGDASQAEIGEPIGCDARSVRRRPATLRGLGWSPVKVETVHRSRGARTARPARAARESLVKPWCAR